MAADLRMATITSSIATKDHHARAAGSTEAVVATATTCDRVKVKRATNPPLIRCRAIKCNPRWDSSLNSSRSKTSK